MKKLITVLSVISLLAIASASYAHDGWRHERHRHYSRYDTPVMIKVFWDSGRYEGMRRVKYIDRYYDEPRYVRHKPHKKRFWYKKFYRDRYERPFWEHRKHRKHHKHGRSRWDW